MGEVYGKSPERLIKARKTCLERYGVDNYLKTKEWKTHYNKIKKNVIEKQIATKKKNHTFNTSKPEENLYKLLCDKYGYDNIKRQYKSKEYPWCCDFYIKILDCYMELQGYYTHNTHPYNEINDKDELNRKMN